MAVAFVLIALAVTGSATAQTPRTGLVVDITRPGWIDLVLAAPERSRADFAERVGRRLVPLGSTIVPRGGIVLGRAARWRCDRLVRRFEAFVVAPDGTPSSATFSVRTPSCRERLAVTLARRTAGGRPVRVGIRDRWGIGGVRATLCAAHSTRRLVCRAVTLGEDQARRAPSFRPVRAGRWRVEVRLAGFTVRRALQVGPGRGRARHRSRRPMLLATGDSTMQGIDSYLAERLARVAQVRSEVRVGTGISELNQPSWEAFAGRQTRRLRPRVTVVSLGAYEGFPMPLPSGVTAHCCGEPWVAEYARRVRSMMRSYARRGAGRVIWLTHPPPRDPSRAAMTTAVNDGTRRAAEGLSTVLLLRTDKIFSPDGRYHPTLRIRGREVRVRSPDGIHLTAAGTEIVARAVTQAIRKSRALPGLSR